MTLRTTLRTSLVAALGAICISCGTGVPVRVLQPNQTVLTASVGGPVVPDKSPLVLVPYTLVGVQHGVSEKITIHANGHALLAAYGVLGLDVGVSARVFKQDSYVPELTLGLTAIGFTTLHSLASSRVYPNLHLICSWLVNQDWLLYAGAHNVVQSNGEYFFSPLIGLQFPVTSQLSLKTEFMAQALNRRTSSGYFQGASSINNNGSAGLFIGAVWEL